MTNTFWTLSEIRQLANMVRRSAIVRVPTGSGLAYLLAGAIRAEHPLSLALGFNARQMPEKPAVCWKTETEQSSLTYRQLDARVNRLANVLSSLGAGPRVAVSAILPNRPEFFETSYACARLGVCFTPIGTRLKSRSLRHIFTDSGAGILVTDRDHLDAIPIELRAQLKILVVGANAPTPETGEPDAALYGYEWELGHSRDRYPPRSPDGHDEVVMYTSGTTGKPKGARRNVRSSGPIELLHVVDAFDFNRFQRLYICTPLYHAAPWAFCTMALSLGATVVLRDRWRGLDTLMELNDERITALLMVPTLIRRWLDLPRGKRQLLQPQRLSRVVSAGAAFPESWKREAIRELGNIFYDFYGATEIGIISVSKPEDTRRRPDTVGRVMPYVDLRLVDEQGREVPPGEPGEIYARGQNFAGYHGNEAATAERTLEGYFSVGDIGVLDPDGYLSIVGRKADMIVSGGVNIYPAEIEAVIREHPAVSDAAVIGVPDDEFGEAVHAFVVCSPDTRCSGDDVVEWCVSELARYKRPRGVSFVAELPHSPQGKVLKAELRQWFEESASG